MSMEIKFKGTIDEFRAVFGGVSGVPFEPSDLSAMEEADELKIEVPPPLAVVPQAQTSPLPDQHGPGEAKGDRPSMPTNDPTVVAGTVNLPKLGKEQRAEAWEKFVEFCAEWAQGFEDPEEEQPDRLSLMQDIGSGQWPVPVLVMAYETKSLQMMVCRALEEKNGALEHDFADRDAYLDYIDRLAANMVQVSHMGFPDLVGTYDYSLRWRRSS